VAVRPLWPRMLGHMTLLAVVWHYWIAVLLVIPTVLLVIATAVGYVVKVLGPKYSGRPR